MEISNTSAMMIDKNHQVISTLGIGGAGEVYATKNIVTNTMYAAKFARKDLKVTQAKKLMLLQRERDTMEDLNEHPNILTSYHLYKKRKAIPQPPSFDISKQEFDIHLTTSPFHLIEYCENGSFISYMRNQSTLPESIVVFYAEQLISAIEYIHYKGYAHLDIKLDNILLDDYFNIRLSDFGSALKVDDNPFTVFRRGTPKYMAPEVFQLQDGKEFDAYKADIYSLGVCLYLMLFKRFPVYEGASYPATMDLFNNPETLDSPPFDCEKSRWTSLSPEIRRIMVACLNQDPNQRPNSQQLVENFFLPPQNQSIEEMVFEEMQERRSKYEQSRHEKAIIEQKFIQPVQCEENPVCDKHENAPNTRPVCHKSGSSTNVSTHSRN
jgi:serine/threonine protein kinase